MVRNTLPKWIDAVKWRYEADVLPRFVILEMRKHGRGPCNLFPVSAYLGPLFPDLVVTFPVTLMIGHKGHIVH
jgi:hypothetical protein